MKTIIKISSTLKLNIDHEENCNPHSGEAIYLHVHVIENLNLNTSDYSDRNLLSDSCKTFKHLPT